MNRGDVYRCKRRIPERGDKPGFYVVVSRQFICSNNRVSTVVCAPVFGEVNGLSTEVVIGPENGVAQVSSIRCDFLMSLFKRDLTNFVATLPPHKILELDRALAEALSIAVLSPNPLVGATFHGDIAQSKQPGFQGLLPASI